MTRFENYPSNISCQSTSNHGSSTLPSSKPASDSQERNCGGLRLDAPGKGQQVRCLGTDFTLSLAIWGGVGAGATSPRRERSSKGIGIGPCQPYPKKSGRTAQQLVWIFLVVRISHGRYMTSEESNDIRRYWEGGAPVSV